MTEQYEVRGQGRQPITPAMAKYVNGPLMRGENLPVVDTINSKGNKFVSSVKIKAACDSKLNDSLAAQPQLIQCTYTCK